MNKKYILEIEDLQGTKADIYYILARRRNIELTQSAKGTMNYRATGMKYFNINGDKLYVTAEVKMDLDQEQQSMGRFGTIAAKYKNVRVIYTVQNKLPANRFW